jgi:hemolysin activation/secretion protein
MYFNNMPNNKIHNNKVVKQLVCLTLFVAMCSGGLAMAEVNVPAETGSRQALEDIEQALDKAIDKKAPETAKPENTELEKKELSAGEKAEAELIFNVFEIKVNGNSVLPIGTIEETVYPFLGETKTIADVEKARVALEKTYQDAGYLTVSVSIPQQEVGAGVVTLKVTEGSVDRLRIKDSQYSSLAEIKSRVGEFAEGKVPHFPTAQKQLGTVNRGQNRQVTPILRAGRSPGKVEVDLKVQDKLPLHGNLELNNKYSPNTTETRLNGGLRYENLWQKDHSIGISFQVTPEDLSETKVVSATYLIPRLNGDYFAAYGVISKSDISAVGDVNVIGNGYIFGARYIKPLPLLDNFYHSLTFGADYKDFDESVNLLGSDGFKTPIAYSAFLLGYDGTYQGGTSQTQFNLGINFATRSFGNSEKEFREKRSFAKPNYAYLRADIKHTQKLPQDWSLQAKLSGQVASDPLVSAEQFTIGGADSVRGYLESQALGDYGVSGSLELRTPPLVKFIQNNAFKDYIKELFAFTFIDAGTVTTLKPLPNQDESSDLYSVGLGLRLKLPQGFFTNLDYAHALREAGDVEKGDDRVHFRVGYEW